MSSVESTAFLKAKVEYCDVGRAKLAFRRFGRGEPIVLVHGWPLSGLTYRKIIPRLADRYTCFAVDLAGAGESSWHDDNDFSFHGHADNLARWIRELGLAKYRIIAHDTGATVARRLAALEGSRVVQGVFIDTEIPNHRPPLVETFQKAAALPGMALAFKTLLRSKAFLRSNGGFGGCFVDKSLIDDDFIEHFVTPLIDSKKKLDGQMRYVRGIDWRQLDALAMDHARISAQSIFIWGDRDPFFPVDRARLMVHQLPRCKGLIVVPGTKLLPHEEKPVVVADHIRAFFAESSALS